MRKCTPVFIVYISTITHNHEPLAGARPQSWLDRNGHGADQPGANMEGGGSDVAGTTGGVGGCARWVLGWLGLARHTSCRVTIGPWHDPDDGSAGTMGKPPAT